MNSKIIRKYISVNDIQKHYLPLSKKRIRLFIKKYLSAKIIGNRLFVERDALEAILNDSEKTELPL